MLGSGKARTRTAGVASVVRVGRVGGEVRQVHSTWPLHLLWARLGLGLGLGVGLGAQHMAAPLSLALVRLRVRIRAIGLVLGLELGLGLF